MDVQTKTKAISSESYLFKPSETSRFLGYTVCILNSIRLYLSFSVCSVCAWCVCVRVCVRVCVCVCVRGGRGKEGRGEKK